MNIIALCVLLFLCTVFSAIFMEKITFTNNKIPNIITPILYICTTISFAAIFVMPVQCPESIVGVIESVPISEIKWSKISYNVIPSGYEILYEHDYACYKVEVPQDDSTENVSQYVTERTRYDFWCFYAYGKDRHLYLSNEDYKAVVDWIDGQEKQKAEEHAKNYYQLNNADL